MYNNDSIGNNNIERKNIKNEKIDEIYDIIMKEWENNTHELQSIDYKKKTTIFWKETNISKSYKILLENWFINNYLDYEEKIFDLHDLGYSFEQIWKAIENVCKYLDINIQVKLHKNTVKRFIDRIIDKQKIAS